MKKAVMFVFMTGLVLTLYGALISVDDEDSLVSLYRKGQVALEEIAVVRHTDLPEGEFFEAPIGLDTDEKGNLYVLDYKACDIKVFDSQGKFLRKIGRRGQGPGEFEFPGKMAFSAGKIFVYDLQQRAIVALNEQGEQISRFRFDFKKYGSVEKMATLPPNGLYIEFDEQNFLTPEKPQESRIMNWSGDEQEPDLVVMNEYRSIKYFTPFNGKGISYPFYSRVHWDVLPGGNLVVGHSKEYKIHVISPEGKEITSFSHPYEPVRISEKDKKRILMAFENISGGKSEKEIAREYVKNIKWLKHHPVFDRIVTDTEGHILVFPKFEDSKSEFFDVFTEEGKYVIRVETRGKIQLGKFMEPSRISRDGFWRIDMDENGHYLFKKYRLVEGR